jgi:hypothetical protein
MQTTNFINKVTFLSLTTNRTAASEYLRTKFHFYPNINKIHTETQHDTTTKIQMKIQVEVEKLRKNMMINLVLWF